MKMYIHIYVYIYLCISNYAHIDINFLQHLGKLVLLPLSSPILHICCVLHLWYLMYIHIQPFGASGSQRFRWMTHGTSLPIYSCIQDLCSWCAYIYTHIQDWSFTCVCIYTQVYIIIWYVCTCTYIYVCGWVGGCGCVCAYVYVCVCICVNMCARVRVCILYVHVHDLCSMCTSMR